MKTIGTSAHMLLRTLPPVPGDETERLQRVAQLGISPAQRHEALDHVVELAAALCHAPIALLTLVGDEQVAFLAKHGVTATGAPRAGSFCAASVQSPRVLAIDDALAEPRFADNPLVRGEPRIRAYLGAPLFASALQSGLGSLCVLDRVPREWTAEQRGQLNRLASLAESHIEGLAYRRAWDDSPLSFVLLDRHGRCVRANPAFGRMLGRPVAAIVDQPLTSCVVPGDRALVEAMLSFTLTQRQSPTRRELRFVRLTGEVVAGGVNMSPLTEPDDQVVCGIRDISLERRTTARSGVVAEVRAELQQPVDEARRLVAELGAADSDQVAKLSSQLASLAELLEARMGDVAGRVRAEEELRASEQRVRALVEFAMGMLLVIDDRGRIVDANSPALAELGWEHHELVGKSMSAVLPEFTLSACERWYARSEHRREPDLRIADDERDLVRRDSSTLRAELRFMAMDWNGPGRLAVLARDVTRAHEREQELEQERDVLQSQVRTHTQELTELQRMEEELKRSLSEKETLLKEIHHRVKNNLQIVSSLLTLQMEQMTTREARAMLTESVHRVRSMALVHQHLYGSTSLERVDLGAYAQHLTETLRYVLAPHARVEVDASSVEATSEHAIPLGLVLNELLTNAFKYGCPAREAGEVRPPDAWDVRVELTEAQRRLRLVVTDRGPGLPTGFDPQRTSSLGLQLVRSLTRQLKGRFTARSEGGAVFEFTCPL